MHHGVIGSDRLFAIVHLIPRGPAPCSSLSPETGRDAFTSRVHDAEAVAGILAPAGTVLEERTHPVGVDRLDQRFPQLLFETWVA
ncbi:MAG TPA: hypothetical protein VIX82_10375 [Solirubrobacteraceae bacterium]